MSTSAFQHEPASSTSAKGVDALCIPVMTPDNSEAMLKFQWMKLHPMTLIGMSDAVVTKDEGNPTATEAALQVSKMFPRYREAIAAKNQSTWRKSEPRNETDQSVATSASRDESLSRVTYQKSPFLQVSGIGVDLSELFEPPLLSGSVPIFLDEEELNESNKRQCLTNTNNNAQLLFENNVDVRIQEALENLVSSAFVEVESKFSIETTELRLDSISSLTASELPVSLSSILLCRFLKEKYQERKKGSSVDDGNESLAGFFLVSLILLAKFVANERMGRHVLQILARPILADCNTLVTNPNFAAVGTRLFQRMATALVTKCSLGLLSKNDLLQLMPELDDAQGETHAAMGELYCCLSEAYSSSRRPRESPL